MNPQTFIGLIITAVWALNYIIAVTDRTYHPPVEVNAVMLLAAGYYFGRGILKGQKDEDDG